MMPTKILAIDDDGIHLLLLQKHLQDHGYEVRLASDGRQAIELARKHAPDLILCDVLMPGFDGFRVMAGLKANAATEDIPVILMTGSPREEDERRAATAGASAYLPKAERFGFLVQRIEERLAGATSLRQMRGAVPPPTDPPRPSA
jgi:CheY-like chemotaxis protein